MIEIKNDKRFRACPDCGDAVSVRIEGPGLAYMKCRNPNCALVGYKHRTSAAMLMSRCGNPDLDDLVDLVDKVWTFMHPPKRGNYMAYLHVITNRDVRRFINKSNRKIYEADVAYRFNCDNGSEGKLNIDYSREGKLFSRDVVEFMNKTIEITNENLTLIKHHKELDDVMTDKPDDILSTYKLESGGGGVFKTYSLLHLTRDNRLVDAWPSKIFISITLDENNNIVLDELDRGYNSEMA